MNASRSSKSFSFRVAMMLAVSNPGQIAVFARARMGVGGFLTVTSFWHLCIF